jgi:2-hydroxy-6-oxonona-2,4-dienedioate hydrolase
MEALVFVHGYLGGSAQWADQVEAFGSSFRVITPDLPGFGLNRDREAPDEIGAFADYALEQVRDAGVDRFHLVGHSMGGMIVQEMVARAPERVDRLVLYGTGPVGLLPGRFETIDESKRRVVADGVKACGRRISATWFVDYEQAPNYPVCADLAELASEQAALAGLSAMEKWSGESALAGISSPTLVLWGDCDRTYMWSQQQRLWEGISGARLGVIPGCAHAVHLEKPGLFNAMLADFLETGA